MLYNALVWLGSVSRAPCKSPPARPCPRRAGGHRTCKPGRSHHGPLLAYCSRDDSTITKHTHADHTALSLSPFPLFFPLPALVVSGRWVFAVRGWAQIVLARPIRHAQSPPYTSHSSLLPRAMALLWHDEGGSCSCLALLLLATLQRQAWTLPATVDNVPGSSIMDGGGWVLLQHPP